MSNQMMWQHLFRAWSRHWPLQIASVTVMTVVLLILNLMFLGFSAFNHVVAHWGQGLEMIVYVKEDAAAANLTQLKQKLAESGDFAQIQFVSKNEATKKFLTALGPESLELLKDPKWNSPIPASFELRLSETIPTHERVAHLETWAGRLRALATVEDVFYGQGWVENFSRFLSNTRAMVVAIWILSLSVGLLIVSNCIRLSFLHRRDEIEVLELVGATQRFIRMPFLVEGLTIGLLASAFSLMLSLGLHTLLLGWLGQNMDFWLTIQEVPPLQFWFVIANIMTGVGFGVLGAWNCVRKLNTGWAAVG